MAHAHICFCIVSLWLFYWRGSWWPLQRSCSFLCTVLEQDLRVAIPMPVMWLVVASRLSSPPLPGTWRWPLSLRSLLLHGDFQTYSQLLSLAPYSYHRIPTQVPRCCPRVRPPGLGVSVHCPASGQSASQVRFGPTVFTSFVSLTTDVSSILLSLFP